MNQADYDKRARSTYNCTNCAAARYSTYCKLCDDHYCFSCIKAHSNDFICTSCKGAYCIKKEFVDNICLTCACAFKLITRDELIERGNISAYISPVCITPVVESWEDLGSDSEIDYETVKVKKVSWNDNVRKHNSRRLARSRALRESRLRACSA